MPQDAFTLKILSTELDGIFCGGKVNRIIQPDNDQVVFTIYTGSGTKKLLINVNPSMPRIGITEEEKAVPLTALNFCMLLRKHLLNATVDKIGLVGFDRIVKIDFTAYCEFALNVKKTLYVELMGRYSNIILTENNKVLGGNRGINMFDDGVRPLIIGKDYVFPPVGDKISPFDSGYKTLIDSYKGDDLCSYILNKTQGVALSTVKEMLNGGETNVYESIQSFIKGYKTKPCVLYLNGEIKDFFAFPSKVPLELSNRLMFEPYHVTSASHSSNYESLRLDAKAHSLLINKKLLGSVELPAVDWPLK